MGIHISIPIDMFKEVEKRMRYRFWNKEQQRSNRAAQLREYGAAARRCLTGHKDMAWSGPEHNPIRVKMGMPPEKVRAYVCISCHAAACEPEIKDRGFEFDTITDFEIHDIMDLDLERQANWSAQQHFKPKR